MGAAVSSARAALDAKAAGAAPPRPITVTHVDLTDNPWGTVFKCVAAAPGYADPPRSFVYAQGSPSGFYSQAFPSGSLALAHGAATFHWGSSAPPSLPDQCLFPWLASDPAVRAACAAQAAADWAAILRHRAAELRPGGRFVAALVAAPPPPPGVAPSTDLAPNLPLMWRHAAETWAGMAAPGAGGGGPLLTREEAAGVVIPVNLSTPSQLAAPFSDDSTPQAIGSLFSVLKAEAIDMAFPQWTAYQASGDAASYAAALRLFLEAVLKGMQVASVAARRAGRPDGAASAAAAVDAFYDRLEAVLAADPQPASQMVVILHLERRQEGG